MITEEVRRLFESAIVIDGLDVSEWGNDDTYTQLRAGGVTAINATLTVWEGFSPLADQIQRWLTRFDEFATLIRPVHDVSDIRAAKAEGRTGVIFGVQDTAPIENDLGRIQLLYALGVRIMQLTYNERNLIGDGCYESTDVGLSRFGHDVIREMNATGILIDLSHCGNQTTLEAIDASAIPVAITHSNARALFPHPRNKSDEVIRLLSDRKGVIGANAYPLFFPNGYETTIGEFVDGIEYLIELAGIDHVAIGTDFCHGRSPEWFAWAFSTSHGRRLPESLPEIPHPHRQLIGFEDARRFVDLCGALLDRGYSEADVRKVLGENWLRLFSETWCTS
jgi:membrane dipeptidase